MGGEEREKMRIKERRKSVRVEKKGSHRAEEKDEPQTLQERPKLKKDQACPFNTGKRGDDSRLH